jgi:hypothetical protein
MPASDIAFLQKKPQRQLLKAEPSWLEFRRNKIGKTVAPEEGLQTL